MEYQVQSPTGEMHVIDGPEGASDADITAAAQQLFGTSTSESFGRAAINNLPLGGQIGAMGTMVMKNEPYSQALSEFNTKTQEAKAEHPIAYGAGAVTGSIAPLAIPGVGEAMASAPELTGAALGAANAIGNTNIVQNPEEAVKQTILGGTTGAVLGAILPTGTKTAESLESYANKKGVQALNLRPGTLGVSDEELENLGLFAHETGLIEGSTQERLGKAQDLLQQVGAQIGNIGGGSRYIADASPFTDRLQEEAEKSAKFFGTEGNQDLNLYRQGIANIQANGTTFDELQALKNAYGDKAFNANGEVTNTAAAKIYGTIKDAMKAIIDESPEEYQDLMTSYGTLKDIHAGLTNQLQQEQARGVQARGFGMVGKLTGMLGKNPALNVGAAAALAPAHPFMAMGALTPIATNPQAVAEVARSAAVAIPTAAKAITAGSIDAVTSYLLNTLNTSPKSLGRFAAPLSQAAKSGGSQGIAATHFLLSQQYPDYNEMMMKNRETRGEMANRGTQE